MSGTPGAALKAAQETNAALDAELAAQDAKWIKSYDRARELAASARLARKRRLPMRPPGRRAPKPPRPPPLLPR